MPGIVFVQPGEALDGNPIDPNDFLVEKQAPPWKSFEGSTNRGHRVHIDMNRRQFVWPLGFEVVEGGRDDVAELVAPGDARPGKRSERIRWRTAMTGSSM